jgi:hypothetical protein
MKGRNKQGGVGISVILAPKERGSAQTGNVRNLSRYFAKLLRASNSLASSSSNLRRPPL